MQERRNLDRVPAVVGALPVARLIGGGTGATGAPGPQGPHGPAGGGSGRGRVQGDDTPAPSSGTAKDGPRVPRPRGA